MVEDTIERCRCSRRRWIGGSEGRQDAGRVGAAVRRASEPDQGLLEGAAGVLCAEAANAAAVDVKTLHAKIGQLTRENDVLVGALGKARHAERKAVIDRPHELPLSGRPSW